ncbi:hypothetical protein FS749_002366 [Ceratobasidium sp. UAMH 11750]|nr:hypothetical protein FS749_002366 [Ceratobasidium sp. UAMH 11750]
MPGRTTRTRSSNSASEAPEERVPRKRRAPTSKPISWTDEMKIHILQESDKEENRIVLRGKKDSSENTSGESKTTVYRRIAKEVIPEVYNRDPIDAGSKVMNQYNALVTLYSRLSKELTKTGNGVGGDVDEKSDGVRQLELDNYIPAGGPTEATSENAVNTWNALCEKCAFFPLLHELLSTRPSQVPIATTTGIGPSGPQTVLFQPPSPSSSPDWNFGRRLSSPASNAPSLDAPLDSDVEILELSRSPTPVVEGNGKGVDPREHQRPVKSDTKAKTRNVTNSTGKMKGKEEKGKEGKVKKEEKEEKAKEK